MGLSGRIGHLRAPRAPPCEWAPLGSGPLCVLVSTCPKIRDLSLLFSVTSVCNFVDALVAIYQLRVLVKYVCTRYVCTPSPLPPRSRIGRLLGTRQQASLEARWTR